MCEFATTTYMNFSFFLYNATYKVEEGKKREQNEEQKK
jgi:hypothetical protein